MEFPRLLIVSPSAFNNLSGGGITFTNLFHDWPRDRIATVTSDHVPVTHDVCERYYFLTKKEFPWNFPFSIANLFGGQEKMERNLQTAQNVERGKSVIADALRIGQRLAQQVFGKELPINPRLSTELVKWISDFRPQVLYTILGNLPYIRFVMEIADMWKLPIVIHMMDDWPVILYSSGIFGPYRKWRMDVELQGLIDRAASCLAICDAMSEEYEKRYNKPFQAFHNALPAEKWLPKARKSWKAGSPFILLYAGALIYNSQLESVRDVCDAVATLKHEGLDIKFQIYAPWFFVSRYRSELEREGCVKVFDAPETMDIEELFTSADLLLLPVNFDKDSVKYIRYSMPTKVPAYMFSGTPTLAYGPAEVASIQYAKQWAYCVLEKNTGKLASALRVLMEDEKLRKQLAKKAQHIASQRHDVKKVRRNFHEVFCEAVGNFK